MLIGISILKPTLVGFFVFGQYEIIVILFEYLIIAFDLCS